MRLASLSKDLKCGDYIMNYIPTEGCIMFGTVLDLKPYSKRDYSYEFQCIYSVHDGTITYNDDPEDIAVGLHDFFGYFKGESTFVLDEDEVLRYILMESI